MAWQILLVAQKRIMPSKKLAKFLFVAGVTYFGTMLLCLIAGLTFAADNHWFAAKIPFFFHLVLASFILVLAHYYRVNSLKSN